MKADKTLVILVVIVVIALGICVAQYYVTDDNDDKPDIENNGGQSSLKITIPDDITVTLYDEVITSGTYTIGDDPTLYVTFPAEGTIKVTYTSKGDFWPSSGTLEIGGFEDTIEEIPIITASPARITTVTIEFESSR